MLLLNLGRNKSYFFILFYADFDLSKLTLRNILNVCFRYYIRPSPCSSQSFSIICYPQSLSIFFHFIPLDSVLLHSFPSFFVLLNLLRSFPSFSVLFHSSLFFSILLCSFQSFSVLFHPSPFFSILLNPSPSLFILLHPYSSFTILLHYSPSFSILLSS